jgi:hypothetical protein
MIIGTFGQLAVGKTLSGVIEAYDRYCRGRQVFSNIPLTFPHEPIKEPKDFIRLRNGFVLADELWSLVDNRRAMSKLNDIMTIICIRSSKKHFEIFYTQQYLQIDPRLCYITNYWIEPKTFDKYGRVCTRDNGFIPEYMIQHIRDANWVKLPDQVIGVRPYINLYNNEDDPYTLRASLTDKALQEAFDEALSEEPKLEDELIEIKEKARKSDRGKRREI